MKKIIFPYQTLNRVERLYIYMGLYGPYTHGPNILQQRVLLNAYTLMQRVSKEGNKPTKLQNLSLAQ
jgi:hypothetical protein